MQSQLKNIQTFDEPLPSFDRFFELGSLESTSPFLTPSSRNWGSHLTLKASLVAAVLLIVSFALSWYPSLKPLSHLSLLAVYFLAGIPALIESLEDLSDFDINIDILMTVAAFSSVLIGSGMEGGLLLVLFALSGSMEDAVTAKAKNAISSLNELSPTRACVIEDGLLIERALNSIALNTKILVRAGQIVPLDGQVIHGSSSVNLVHLTGENFPISKKIGDNVPAGARNLDGTLTLNVTHTSADSTLAKIIELVTEAQESRPKLQRWFDSLSRSYAITIILLSALFAVSFPFLFSIPFLGTEGSLYRALSFLIAASPCALIIAIPIAYLSAVSACARKGILIKGGVSLDALASCSTIAFDKTGTLTTGDLKCQEIEPLDANQKVTVSEALAIAYGLERNAVHPIAKAILLLSTEKGVSPYAIEDFKAIPGQGLEGFINLNNKRMAVAIGNPHFILEKLEIQKQKNLTNRIEAIKANGDLVAVLLIENMPYLFKFQDTIRDKAKETLVALKKQKLKLIMLSGDHSLSAAKIASELNLDDFFADLKPENKLEFVTELSKEHNLAMIGDGINDAPALARATSGICMGKVGSTAAIDAADIVLLNDNIEHLNWLFNKAKLTTRIVKQNLSLAIGAIIMASLPALAGWIPLWVAVVMHEGGTVLVGLNALRLLRK